MNKLQKVFLIFYVILNISSVVFGMQGPNPKEPVKAIFYKKNEAQDSFFTLGTDTKQIKSFANNEKHGSCSIENIDGKWFFQPINISNSAMIGPKIEIEPADRELKLELSRTDNLQKLVIEINGKNYLFVRNSITCLKPLLPYKDINQIAYFYSAQHELILENGAITQDDAISKADYENNKRIGILSNHIGNKIFIDMYENEKCTQTISLNMSEQYYQIIQQLIIQSKTSPLTLSYDEDNSTEKIALKIQTSQKIQDDSKSEKALQISYTSCKLEHNAPYHSETIYSATSAKCIERSEKKEYEIKFNIAGIEFVRFVEPLNGSNYYGQNDSGKYYIKIDDIASCTYVCFLKPEDHNGSDKQIVVNTPDKGNNPADSIEDIIKTRITEISNDASQTVIAYIPKSQVFLSTYNGVISSAIPPSRYLLKIDDFEKPICFITMNDTIPRSITESISLILQDRDGSDLCYVHVRPEKKDGEKKGKPIIKSNDDSATSTTISNNFSLRKFFLHYRLPLVLIGIVGSTGILAWLMKSGNAKNITT